MTRWHLPWSVLFRSALLVALSGGIATISSADAGLLSPASAARAAVPAVVSSQPGSASVIPNWTIQSSSRVPDDDATVSRPGYATAGWYQVATRSTVLGGLLDNGVYADPFYSANLTRISKAAFTVPWWYRAEFTLDDATGVNTFVEFSGVTSAADVWINGVSVATHETVAGTYPRREFNLTARVHAGRNAIAFKVFPNDPDKNLTMGWIDWLQPPPDQNMGLVRDVTLRRSGVVALRGAHVLTKLALPSLDSADVTAKVDARNDSGTRVHTAISGTVAGEAVRLEVDLEPHETRTLTFPKATLLHPRVWWPAGMGGQPLYDLALTAAVGGTASDTTQARFGIRDVQAPVAGGARRYVINGRRLLIRGGGWSPDEFLRSDARYLEDRIRYTRDLGLNTIRLEGHLESDEFFDLADRYGILTLPGWECCDKWESQSSEGGGDWSAADLAVATESAASEARRLRNHPSVISFLVGSDNAPPPATERRYADALAAADWPTPIVAAASTQTSPITGMSGMKMTGPYDWVPPKYWYDKRAGGAAGFNSETSAGPDIPTIDTLRRMMSPDELKSLWSDPGAKQYHRSPSDTFSTLRIFDEALASRYGPSAGLDDYVRKAQLAQYENVRAQFEAYGRNFHDASDPSTGVIYWMLNSGWTSLHWQLFDRYLDQNGAYFGAKKANEALHVQYSYDDRSVVVVNQGTQSRSGLAVEATVFDVDGTQRSSTIATGVTAPGDGGSFRALTVPPTAGLSGAYLLRLRLTDTTGKELGRNVYWLSTKDDVIDWSRNDWYYVPTSSTADLRALTAMPHADVNVQASSVTGPTGSTTTTVTLRNAGPGKAAAFFIDAHVVDSHGTPILPIQWDENDVSLWPGESVTLTATYRTADLHGSTPSVRLAGWNIPTRTVPTQ